MLKSFLKKLLIVILELAIIAGALWYIAGKKGIKYVDQIMPALQNTAKDVQDVVQDVQQRSAPFPELSDPVVKTFNFEYKGKKYVLNETLYQSVYEYYKNLPKKYSYVGKLPENWEEEYYKMFLERDKSDETIVNLAYDLQSLGKKQKLTDDQIVELVVAFVQSISYDDAKAKNILAKTESETMLFPYEILWEQRGVCSDKSILTYAILREMGYGAALFVYEDNNHMAVAIGCPKNYSTYGSGYCYAETTSVGNKIGIVPNIDIESNRAIDLSKYDPNQVQKINLQELGQVTILLATEGKQYFGIIETEKIVNEISDLREKMATLLPKLQPQKNNIDDEEDELKGMEDDLEKYKEAGNYEKYNSLAEEFNDLIKEYKKDVKKYNSDVELYNQYVQRYNTLIKQ